MSELIIVAISDMCRAIYGTILAKSFAINKSEDIIFNAVRKCYGCYHMTPTAMIFDFEPLESNSRQFCRIILKGKKRKEDRGMKMPCRSRRASPAPKKPILLVEKSHTVHVKA